MEDHAVDGMSDRLAHELRRATIARSRAEHRWDKAVADAASSGATPKEIARAARTSEATVLRVLRQQPSEHVYRRAG